MNVPIFNHERPVAGEGSDGRFPPDMSDSREGEAMDSEEYERIAKIMEAFDASMKMESRRTRDSDTVALPYGTPVFSGSLTPLQSGGVMGSDGRPVSARTSWIDALKGMTSPARGDTQPDGEPYGLSSSERAVLAERALEAERKLTAGQRKKLADQNRKLNAKDVKIKAQQERIEQLEAALGLAEAQLSVAKIMPPVRRRIPGLAV